ncbi:MAG: LexA family transcriptional regulator [Methylocystaceae bacterium]|nr:LexA family transcriptional regulator [Methylocystaceae bacterium]
MAKPKQDIDPQVGERLTEIRKDRKLSQAAFAEILGISARTLQQWEQGKAHPDFVSLQKLVDQSVDANWVLTGKGRSALASTQAPQFTTPFISSENDQSVESCTLILDDKVVTMQVTDNAMAPSYHKGDLILLSRCKVDIDQTEGPVVIQGRHGPTVRLVRHLLDGRTRMIAENPSYPDEELSEEQASSIHVIGTVVGHIAGDLLH